jgi:hypothetical protein
MKTLLPFLFAFTFLSGCATNPFTQFYESNINTIPVTVQQKLLPPSQHPRVVVASIQDHKEEGLRLMEKNYICIGFSEFVGGAPTQIQLVEQAKLVGADVVVYTSEYSHTEQKVRPFSTYQPGQTNTTAHYGTANANLYGSGGYAYGSSTYSGTSTTTTPGTLRTDYIPYQQQVYGHGASYWRRTK